LLVPYFLDEARRGKTLAAEALDVLQQYAWPGNLWELRTVLQTGTLLASGPVLQVTDLPPEVCTALRKNGVEAETPLAVYARTVNGSSPALKEIKPDAILAALRAQHGKVKHAATALSRGRRSLSRHCSECGLPQSWAQPQRGES